MCKWRLLVLLQSLYCEQTKASDLSEYKPAVHPPARRTIHAPIALSSYAALQEKGWNTLCKLVGNCLQNLMNRGKSWLLVFISPLGLFSNSSLKLMLMKHKAEWNPCTGGFYGLWCHAWRQVCLCGWGGIYGSFPLLFVCPCQYSLFLLNAEFLRHVLERKTNIIFYIYRHLLFWSFICHLSFSDGLS